MGNLNPIVVWRDLHSLTKSNKVRVMLKTLPDEKQICEALKCQPEQILLMVQTCKEPPHGLVENPNGLFGLLGGVGDSHHLNWTPFSENTVFYKLAPLWVLFAIDGNDYIPLSHNWGEVPKAYVIQVGTREEITSALYDSLMNPGPVVGLVRTEPEKKTIFHSVIKKILYFLVTIKLQTVANRIKRTLQKKPLVGGDYSILKGGDFSVITGSAYSRIHGGDYSILEGGERSVVCGGAYSTIKSKGIMGGGINSILIASGKNEKGSFEKIYYVGQDGIEPNSHYQNRNGILMKMD